MNIVFCADRKVLPGLHVAAYSLLDRISPSAGQTNISVFSDVLDDSDQSLLRQTLDATRKPFTLEFRRVEPAIFTGFPALNGSWTTYYRLFAAQVMEVDQFLYLDADTLCDLDVSELQSIDMTGISVAWVPEAPLAGAADRAVAEHLGNSKTEYYFNAGLILVNVFEWRRQSITQKAMEYLTSNRPFLYDQSALNVVLHGKAICLDERYNCIANMRKNWPFFRRAQIPGGRLIHFLDYPKPWDLLGEFVHPQSGLWRSVLEKTAMKGFRSWQATPARKLPNTRKAWLGYKRALKDRILFTGYSTGLLRNVKGITG